VKSEDVGQRSGKSKAATTLEMRLWPTVTRNLTFGISSTNRPVNENIVDYGSSFTHSSNAPTTATVETSDGPRDLTINILVWLRRDSRPISKFD